MTSEMSVDSIPAELERVPAEAATLIIFGGTGDLARRKLLPALYNLYLDGLLPDRTAVVGVGRTPLSDDSYRELAREGITRFSRQPIDEDRWNTFAGALFFVPVDRQSSDGFAALGARLDTIEHQRGLSGNRVYYLAVPPSAFEPTIQRLAHARFVGPRDETPFARLIVEKPIGHDLASAVRVNDAIGKVFHESQIYRIDHYLGKETVQNILVLRFANSIFEPLFNQKYVDHVQITVAESEGVGTRAGYYDRAGALRDMIQNHLLQLLTLVAMEAPYSLDADAVRDEKLQVLRSLRPLDIADLDGSVVRAQYGAGHEAGEPVAAYADESGVAAGTRTETYVALRVCIDSWRWAGVPFLLRTGKRLPQRATEIALHLKAVPPILFNRDRVRPLEPNVLVLRIQPDEGFSLGISSKVPGTRLRIEPVDMNFRYTGAFCSGSPEAYERLLLDVLAGDTTLFMRRDSVEAAWAWVTPILDRWAEQSTDALPTYASGTWGPREADRLLASDSRRWRTF